MPHGYEETVIDNLTKINESLQDIFKVLQDIKKNTEPCTCGEDTGETTHDALGPFGLRWRDVVFPSSSFCQDHEHN